MIQSQHTLVTDLYSISALSRGSPVYPWGDGVGRPRCRSQCPGMSTACRDPPFFLVPLEARGIRRYLGWCPVLLGSLGTLLDLGAGSRLGSEGPIGSLVSARSTSGHLLGPRIVSVLNVGRTGGPDLGTPCCSI